MVRFTLMPKALNNYAFIDGTNLYRSMLYLGWKLDYKRFRVFLRDKYNVGTAYIFWGMLIPTPDYTEACSVGAMFMC